MIRLVEAVGEKWLLRVLIAVWRQRQIPDNWRVSILFPLYKNKGDIHNCGQYRGIKLLSQCMKVLERIVDGRIRKVVEGKMGDEQFGFRSGRSTTDLMFAVRQIVEKKLEMKKDSYWAFLDMEKAYDKVPRRLIWAVLRWFGVPEALIEVVQAMYRDPRTTVRTAFGLSGMFPVGVGVHQGSALSPLLFILVMDYISKQVGGDRSKKLLYADDVALQADSEQELQRLVAGWSAALKAHGMKLSIDKTVVLAASVGDQKKLKVMVEGKQLEQVKSFKYLGGVVEERGTLDEEVKARIRSAGANWRKMSGIVYDRRMPMKLKSKVYKTVVRPVLLYGTETWAAKAEHMRKLGTMEMKCLRRVVGCTLWDRRRNEDIRAEAKVAPITGKVKENRMRWFGHVCRKREDDLVRQIWERKEEGRRGRGRPVKRWMDCVKEDLR